MNKIKKQMMQVQRRLKKVALKSFVYLLEKFKTFLSIMFGVLEGRIKPIFSKIHDWILDNNEALNFLRLILTFPVILALMWIIINEVIGEEYYLSFQNASMLINIIVFIVYMKAICKILREGRRFSFQSKGSIKYVYLLFACFYCLIIFMSFIKDFIVSTYLDLFTLKSIMITNKLDVYDGVSILWSALNSLKEAILAAIIFDAAYQMYNYNLIDSQKEYLQTLISHGKLYVLPEDKNSIHPRVWYIRGDACTDVVDDLKKYKFKTSRDFVIEYTNKQAEKIVKNRETFGYESNDCMYDVDSDEAIYHFYFTLLDFSNIDTKEFNLEKIYEIIRKDLIPLPIGSTVIDKRAKVIFNKRITTIERIQKKLNQQIYEL